MQTRRRFITGLAATGAATLLPAASARAAQAQRSRVVIVRCASALRSGHAADRDALGRMLEVGLCALAGVRDARAALARWVRPVDTVGLKVNGLAGRQMSTHVELVEALVALLARGGLPRSSAIAFDRSDRDLRAAGFPLRSGGKDYLAIGNDRGGYSALQLMPSGASRVARVASERASVLINLPILKDHGIAGLSAALKNNFGLVHNPNKFHLGGCDPYVAEVNALPAVRGKQRLVICDALRVQVEGGPAYHAAGVAAPGALLLATDPVALDVVAWQLLEALRTQRKLPSLTADKRRPVHILGAARRGLGVADERRIERVERRVG